MPAGSWYEFVNCKANSRKKNKTVTHAMYFWGHFWLIVVTGEAIGFLLFRLMPSINEIFFLENVGFIDRRIQAKN